MSFPKRKYVCLYCKHKVDRATKISLNAFTPVILCPKCKSAMRETK